MTNGPTPTRPYPGPRPFEPGDRSRFFGRDAELADLTSLVVAHRVVLLYAQSGAGKTSLLNAGLIPSLVEQGFDVLPTVRVRGLVSDELAARGRNIFVLNTLMCWSEAGTDGAALLPLSIPQFLQSHGHGVDEDGFDKPTVIVFDQFEELFAFYPERWSEREAFFEQISEALQADPLLHTLFVMREDYVASLDPYAPLMPGSFGIRYRLERLRPRAACEAVERPLEQTPRRFAPQVAANLVDQLLAIRVEDAAGRTREVKGEFIEPVQLQIAVESLWDELPPEVTTITDEHLRTFGDVHQALREFYETALARTAAEAGISEDLLREWFDRRLITPAGTRGTVFRGPDSTEGVPNRAVDLLENRHLIRAELRAGGRWYELTHDRFIGPIQTSNEAWRQRAHEAGVHRKMRSIVGWVALAAAGVLVIAGLVAFGVVQRVATQRAQARELAANALLPSIDPQQSLCLALEAAERAGASDVAHIEGVLRQALRTARVRNVFTADGPILTTRLGRDGRWLVVTSSADGVKISDGASRTAISEQRHSHEVNSVAFSDDGRMMAAATVDGTVHVSNTTGEALFELEAEGQFLTRPQFSSDGRLLLAVSSDGSIRVWDVATGQPRATLDAQNRPAAEEAREPVTAAFNPAGTHVVAANLSGTATIWDLSSRQMVRELIGHRRLLSDARFAPDGQTVLTASEDTSARIWRVSDGSTVAELRGHAGRVTAAAFAPGGQFIVTTGDDGTARIWLAATGDPVATLRGHRFAVDSAAFSTDGRHVVTASADGTARLWDVSEGLLAVMPDHHGVSRIAFAADGTRVVTETDGGVVRVFDAATGAAAPGAAGDASDDAEEYKTDSRWLSSEGEAQVLLATSADGRRLLTVSVSVATVRDAQSAESLHELKGHVGWITTAAFNADGTLVATGSTDNTVRVWPINRDGAPVVLPLTDGVATVEFPRAPVNAATANFLLTTSPSGAARVWDVSAGRVIMELAGTGHVMAAFSRDGSTVATAREDGTVATYRCETCVPLDELRRLARARLITDCNVNEVKDE